MRRLVAAIQALGERDWFDYLSVAVPLILSVIAIWISISTARKQNRIALFSIRHDAIVDVRNILMFESKIQGDTEKRVVTIFYDGFFGTNITDVNEKDAIVQILTTTTKLEKRALIKILARKKQIGEIHDAILALQYMMINIVGDIDATAEKTEFHKACEKLLNGTFEDVCKNVRI